MYGYAVKALLNEFVERGYFDEPLMLTKVEVIDDSGYVQDAEENDERVRQPFKWIYKEYTVAKLADVLLQLKRNTCKQLLTGDKIILFNTTNSNEVAFEIIFAKIPKTQSGKILGLQLTDLVAIEPRFIGKE